MLMLLIGMDQLLFTKVASESTCTVIYQSGHVYISCITLEAGRVSTLNCKNHKCICLSVAQLCVGVWVFIINHVNVQVWVDG